MPVWEYRQIDLNDLPRKAHEVDVLNELGEQGWELVGIMANHVASLKRLATPAQPPRSLRALRQGRRPARPRPECHDQSELNLPEASIGSRPTGVDFFARLPDARDADVALPDQLRLRAL